MNKSEKPSYLKIFFRSLGLIFKSAPTKVTFLMIILALQIFIPVVQATAIAKFIDSVKTLSDVKSAILIMLPFIIAVLIDFLVGPLMMIVQGECTDSLVKKVNMDLFNKVSEVDNLNTLDNPEFYDRLNMLQMEIAFRPINLIVFSFSIIRIFVTIVVMFAQLSAYSIWIPLAFLVGIFPQSYIVYRLQVAAYENTVTRSPFVKQLNYYRDILLGRDFSKERVVFKYGDKFKEDYDEIIDRINGESAKDRRKKGLAGVLVSIFGVVVLSITIVLFVKNVVAGIYTIGALSLFLNYLLYTARSSIRFIEEGSMLLETELFMNTYFEFLDFDFNMASGDSNCNDVNKIEFKNVSFKYPGRDDYALENVSFDFNVGDRLGIVGVNGSGKTTIMKLLLRLYDADSGQILINGKDIKEYDIDELRSSFGVLFQDFNKYEITFRENVELSNINKNSKNDLVESIHRSGADSVLKKFGNNMETHLGKIYNDGVEISGGEWQRIATARTLYHGGNVLIFDEPTSALDPIQEKVFWENLLEDSNIRSAIFTTHRIQGLRRATKFIVLDAGKVVEEGSFDELMNANGKFFELFNAQN